MLMPFIGFATYNYKTATKSQRVTFFGTVFCNKGKLHDVSLKASATHQSHPCAEIDSVAENRLVAHLDPCQ